MLLSILLIIVTGLFILTLIVKRFIYFRPSSEFIAPLDNYEDIYEGNLHAWYKKGTSGKVILFCHGNAGNLSTRQGKLQQLTNMGHSVLIFDYSGYGYSKGVPNEHLCYNNACIFVQYLLRQGYDKDNIVPYGESLGAAVASHIAVRFNLPKLIIESGLPNISKLIKSWNPFLRLISFIFPEFNTEQYLNVYKGRYLVIHSVHDEIISYHLTEQMRGRAERVIIIQGSHNNPEIPWEEVKQFI